MGSASDGILEEQEEEHLCHAVMRQRQMVERIGVGKTRRGGLKSMLENLVRPLVFTGLTFARPDLISSVSGAPTWHAQGHHPHVQGWKSEGVGCLRESRWRFKLQYRCGSSNYSTILCFPTRCLLEGRSFGKRQRVDLSSQACTRSYG